MAVQVKKQNVPSVMQTPFRVPHFDDYPVIDLSTDQANSTMTLTNEDEPRKGPRIKKTPRKHPVVSPSPRTEKQEKISKPKKKKDSISAVKKINAQINVDSEGYL